MRWRRDPSALLRIQWWVLLRLFVWFLKAQIMAVVVGRSLPPAAHLHSLNSFVSKNRSPWSFRQFTIALDRSHLGKLSLLFLIWLHFSLSLSHRPIRMESATSVLLWFLGLATTPNRLFGAWANCQTGCSRTTTHDSHMYRDLWSNLSWLV
jgi:hypothetical protein